MAKHGRSGTARKTDGGFKLDGKEFDTTRTGPGVGKVLKFAAKMKAGELMSSEELASRLGYSGSSIEKFAVSPKLSIHKQLVRFPSRMLVWGSRQTIAGLRKNHKEILA